MNPNVANHYPQEIREKAQKILPKLKIISGGQDNHKSISTDKI